MGQVLSNQLRASVIILKTVGGSHRWVRERKTHHAGRAFIENFIQEREERGERERGCMASWGKKEGETGGAPQFKGRSTRHVQRSHSRLRLLPEY